MKLSISFVALVLSLSVAAHPVQHQPHHERNGLTTILKDTALSGLLGEAGNIVVEHLEGDKSSSAAASAATKRALGRFSSRDGADVEMKRNAIITILKDTALSGLLGEAGNIVVEHLEGDKSNSTSTKRALGRLSSRGGLFTVAKDAILAGAEGLAGTAVVSEIADKIDPNLASSSSSKRSLLSSLIGDGAKDVAEDGAEDAAKDAASAGSSGILSHVKGALVSGVEGLVGSEVVGEIADKIDPNLASSSSSDDSATDAQANSTTSRMVRARRSEPLW